MNKIIVLLTGAWTGLAWSAADVSGQATASEPELLARYHFAGSAQLTRDANAGTLSKALTLPASAPLRERLAGQLSQVARRWHRKTTGLALPPVEVLQPMVADLFQAESIYEIWGRSSQASEILLAAQLDDSRAQLWSTNLWQYLEKNLNGQAVPLTGANGWEFKPAGGGSVVRFATVGNWRILGYGTEPLNGFPKAMRQTKDTGRPAALEAGAWLAARVDFPRLGNLHWPRWTGFSGPLPAMELTLGSKTDYVRTRMTLNFPETLKWQLDTWRIPTNTIRDPLVSFTALQGVGPWLNSWPLLKPLEVETMPNQIYVWAQEEGPFQTYLAAPAPKVTNALEKLGEKLPALLQARLTQHRWGEVKHLTNKTELVWSGLPILAPFLCCAPEPAGNWMLGGIFPAALNTNPPPVELLAQFADRNNLLFYDWEITQSRLEQTRLIIQVADLIFSPPKLDEEANPTNMVGHTWLKAVSPMLGNTVTEITVTSPKQLTLVRKSHIGFNALELVLLTRWLDGQLAPASPKPAGKP